MNPVDLPKSGTIKCDIKYHWIDTYLDLQKYNHSKQKDIRFIQGHNYSTLQKRNTKYMECMNLPIIVTKIEVLVN
jgi:hypothetical protein